MITVDLDWKEFKTYLVNLEVEYVMGNNKYYLVTDYGLHFTLTCTIALDGNANQLEFEQYYKH